MNKPDHTARTSALRRLASANRMIEQGRAELEVATVKIAKAQKLIDECTAVLRNTWHRRKD